VARPTTYREWAAPAPLRHAVACLWTHQLGDEAPNAVLPDGCTDLIWRAGDGAFVAGPDTGPVTSDLRPNTLLVGLRFRPGAGGIGLGVAMDALRDQRVDAADLSPEVARALRPDLTPAEAAGVLTTIAADHLDGVEPDAAVDEAIDLLHDPRVDLGRVTSRVEVGERQLRRRFLAAVGYGPKTLQRVLRFRAFLDGIDREEDLAQAAARCGFADQSHLNRECRDLAGRTPTQLLADRT
jgi:AraC-like DNA-binding protein